MFGSRQHPLRAHCTFTQHVPRMTFNCAAFSFSQQAGLMRFLVPPDLSAEETKKLLDEDSDYFNDLCFDEEVQGMANVLLVSSKMYPYRNAICAPASGTGDWHFSKISGVHAVQWGSDVLAEHTRTFNAMVDKVREHVTSGTGEGSKANEEKTPANADDPSH